MVHVRTENNILAREYASRQINKILEFQVPTYNLLLVLFECFHLIFKWHGGTMDFASMQGWRQRENLERGCAQYVKTAGANLPVALTRRCER